MLYERILTMKRCSILLAAVWLGGGWCAAWAETASKTELLLYLNLPSRTLMLYQGGQEVAHYEVGIGKPSDPTPTGHYQIHSVIFNPNWYNGAIVGTAQQRRTPPGPGNPMGKAKIHFSKNYYLHGTPHPWSVGQAISHGCLRLENRDVLDLARRLMADNAPVDFASVEQTLDAAPPEPREVALNHPVAMIIDYRLLTLNPQGGTIWPAVYRRFPQPLQTVQSGLEQAAAQQGLALQLPAGLIAELTRPVNRRIDFDLEREQPQ